MRVGRVLHFRTDTRAYVYTNTMYGPCLPLDISLRVRVVHASNGEPVRDVELGVGNPLDTQHRSQQSVPSQRQGVTSDGGTVGARMDGWKVGLFLASSGRGRWDVQEGGKESRRRGDSQGVDDVERVAGCGFRGSDAGWLVDGKADEHFSVGDG